MDNFFMLDVNDMETVKVFRNMGEALEMADEMLLAWCEDHRVKFVDFDALTTLLREELKTYSVSTPCNEELQRFMKATESENGETVTYDEIPTFNLQMNPILESEDLARVALMFHTEDEFEDIEVCDNDVLMTTLRVGNREYRVGTDDQSCDAALSTAEESLWAFSPEFWSDYTEPDTVIDIDYWQRIQGDLCEDFDGIIRALCANHLQDLIEDAVRIDGYGHFLATYDGEEHNVELGKTDLFIFRTN